jgi:hypothetical protein
MHVCDWLTATFKDTDFAAALEWNINVVVSNTPMHLV